ncbi:hypothetical protein ACT7V1_001204 [Salmonella enterica subsp. enterica]|nr:hypothetical protein [Citrobacter freundii]QLO06668.1 hypothetical protein HV141_24520 [Citrobacter freundii]
MSSILNLPQQPQKNIIPQQTILTTLVLEAAQSDKTLRDALINNPGKVLIDAGFALRDQDVAGFNQYCQNDAGISALLAHLAAGGEIEQLTGWKCIVCKSVVYPIAIALVAVGAGAVATLTVASPAVLALAAFAGVAAATALAFIVSITTAIAGGVSVVASEICSWTGACS